MFVEQQRIYYDCFHKKAVKKAINHNHLLFFNTNIKHDIVNIVNDENQREDGTRYAK